MLLISKKFLFLLLVMALVFGGEHNSAKGQLKKCWKCVDGTRGGVPVFSPECGDDQDGDPVDCFFPSAVCAMTKDGDKIIKKCEEDPAIWSDTGKEGGNPKCEKNKACYCNDADKCNQDQDFGLDAGTGGGGGTADKSGSVGTEGMFSAMSILFWMVTTVAAACLPSICIPTK